jgi:spermidine synthase
MTTLALAADGDQAAQAHRVVRRTRALFVLFFLAGFPAVIYQLAWQRTLSDILGGGIAAAAILVAGFMLGLGLGSLTGGWLSTRRNIPLWLLLAAIELTSAACGLASLQILGSRDLAGDLSPTAMIAVALACVVVPALPMGAILPLRVGHPVRRSGHCGNAIGPIYSLDSLGAGMACLAGLLLLDFPFAGSQGALDIALAINATVAAGALVLHWRSRRDPVGADAPAPAAIASRPPMLGFVPLMCLAATGGFVALSYEILFLRIVSDATGSSATAFAATLGAFLLGLSVGARQAGDNCMILTRNGVMRRALGALMKANLLGFLLLPLLDHLAWLDRGIIGIAILMVYLVARFWGSLLPYLTELGVAADRHAGGRAAALCLANSLGAAAGALFTARVLLDELGLVASGTALAVAGLLCATLLIGVLAMPRAEKILRTSLAVALALLAVTAIPHWSANLPERLQEIGARHADALVQAVNPD